MFLGLVFLLSSSSTNVGRKRKGLLVIRICLIVPTVTIFVLGLSQQADHADFAELGFPPLPFEIMSRKPS